MPFLILLVFISMQNINFNLKVENENIDLVILKLTMFSNVEIRNIKRLAGLIQIKTSSLDNLSDISEILTIDIDKKLYINRIALI